ncbi:hypothetical protein [Paraglaciecola sp.]|uniref:hypothetical protein n=1 Tax=Paraglaciecola sp. TaxID=1920173 RepID=UPI003EF8DD7D
MNKDKPKNLSANQLKIYDLVSDSTHTPTNIADRCGYSLPTIRKWMYGELEPNEFAVRCMIDTIEILKKVPSDKKVYWSSRVNEIKRFLDSGMNKAEIARAMSVRSSTIHYAIKTYMPDYKRAA